VLTNC